MCPLLAEICSRLPLGATTVRFRKGRAMAARGKIRGALLSDLTEFAAEHDIREACVHASRRPDGGTKLILFGVPPGARQRLRNLWGVHP